MGWKLKTVVFLTLALFVAGCLWVGYVVYARYQGNEYVLQVAASFNAAALVNGEETYTDSDKAVISTYEGRQYVILPDNYRALISLLRKDSAMPLFRRVGRDVPLTIDICDGARLRIQPDRDSVDGALIAFTADSGKRFTMHVHGGNIWKQIVKYATEGRTQYPNLPL